MDVPPPYDCKSQPTNPADPNFTNYPPPVKPDANQPQTLTYPDSPPSSNISEPQVRIGQQQQQYSVGVIGATSAPVVAQPLPAESFAAHIALACFVTLCCNAAFGSMALMLASKYAVRHYFSLLSNRMRYRSEGPQSRTSF